MVDIPTVVTAAGLQPIPPSDIHDNLIALVAETNPGYTANLPGSLVEDISSTDVAALVQMDQMRVELINSLNPRTANLCLLIQLGLIYGVTLGTATNTSVFVVFSSPNVGFVIAKGFTVSDGSHQYVVQDGGVINSGGESEPLFAVATETGTWAVPDNTVTQLVTSVPSTITLTVNNPESGTPSGGAETISSFRSRVLQAGLAASMGMARYLKTLLSQVPGVQPRLISVRQQSGTNPGWIVLCGGGDPYEIAYAIYTALFDISALVGSTAEVVDFTATNPGVVESSVATGYTNGQSVIVSGVTPSNYDGTYSITVIDDTHFSVGVDTSGFPAYVSGGVLSPPPASNLSVSLIDYPDTYSVSYVNPPAQSVSITVTWNTTATNFINPAAIAAAATPALVDYVNSIPVGLPINEFELTTAFQTAIQDLLNPQLLTRVVYSVSIDSVVTAPEAGTGIVVGDPNSYFLTDETLIVVEQG
jgi:hypothetical protein